MIYLLTLNNILKLEFLALTACYLDIPSDYRSSLEYDAPTLPDAIFFRHFVTSCQLEIGYIGFWGSYNALFA